MRFCYVATIDNEFWVIDWREGDEKGKLVSGHASSVSAVQSAGSYARRESQGMAAWGVRGNFPTLVDDAGVTLEVLPPLVGWSWADEATK